MCGIFGYIGASLADTKLEKLAMHARQRGKDSSGLVTIYNDQYIVTQSDFDVIKTLKKAALTNSPLKFGHSRLITNGHADNQPVVSKNIILLHNGIIVNEDQIEKTEHIVREFEIDSEVILALSAKYLDANFTLEEIAKKLMEKCVGAASCILIFPRMGKLMAYSNCGSMYIGTVSGSTCFSSERYPLQEIGCEEIVQLNNSCMIYDIPKLEISLPKKFSRSRPVLVRKLDSEERQSDLLTYKPYKGVRCSRCILPATMPYIEFDFAGVCNYCNNYRLRNRPKPIEELISLLEPYRRKSGPECIIPFSGGRDSCWALHLIVKELKLKAVTYTYDWGMVTDLGRRNLSRMTSKLAVENITVAADVEKKRKYIARNLHAWLNRPELGMISLLTAGDKHFFKYIKTIQQQMGVALNIWGVNPLEVTHFKAGFLGMKPDFLEEKVYSNGALKQLKYQTLRLKEMIKNPGYINSSLWDTISGEYYRSVEQKSDYFHLFDYIEWDERECDRVLATYDWELATDTTTTWRIGDGTAAFYNYVYRTVAGFSEHDTFRSNQIREGNISREDALSRVEEENKPRYQNIKWYLNILGFDFETTIRRVNSIPPLYNA